MIWTPERFGDNLRRLTDAEQYHVDQLAIWSTGDGALSARSVMALWSMGMVRLGRTFAVHVETNGAGKDTYYVDARNGKQAEDFILSQVGKSGTDTSLDYQIWAEEISQEPDYVALPFKEWDTAEITPLGDDALEKRLNLIGKGNWNPRLT